MLTGCMVLKYGTLQNLQVESEQHVADWNLQLTLSAVAISK